MSELLLELDQVRKWVLQGDVRTDILNGVSLTVRQGEFIAIMGASGSGKSTLLNLIGLLDTPTSGTLKLFGRDTTSLSGDELAQLRAQSIGFIFQSFNLLPYLTARQNVELAMAYAGHARAHEHSQALLAQVRMSKRAAAYPPTLSGGEKQRVAIARALANRPALLLADEPTGALDSKTGADVIQLMKELHRAGATLLLVTHDEQVARQAQKIWRMRDGRFE